MIASKAALLSSAVFFKAKFAQLGMRHHQTDDLTFGILQDLVQITVWPPKKMQIVAVVRGT